MTAADLILFTGTSVTVPLSSHSRSSNLLSSHQFSRLYKTSRCSALKSYTNYQTCAPYTFKERGSLIVNVASNADEVGSDDPEPPSESDDESLLDVKLPLEPKLQLKLEQKMRMKLTKKIRLRRKKLVRRCCLRKTGRWPPSKLKKKKNV